MAKKADPPVQPVPAGPGKGRATPTRRAAEAARARPLVPTDRKAAVRASRGRMADERARARVGMAAGEERYLPARDRGPERRFARDSVDGSFRLGELFFPLVGVLVLLTFVLSPAASSFAFVGIYGLVLIMVVDAVLATRRIRRRLLARYGASSGQSGLTLYVITRSLQLRVLRTPKPQVRRGQPPR